MINKVKNLILDAEKEIYMSTNMDLTEFEQEFNEASQKGVRIIIVGLDKYKNEDLQIDKLYTFSNEKQKNTRPKMMIVIDNNKALVSEQNPASDDSIDYTITDDKILVNAISRNIDDYVYVLKLRDNIDFKLRDN